MNDDINTVSMLVRREIEALITVPLLKAFTEAIGKEKTFAIAETVIGQLARDSGKMLAELAGGSRLADLETILPLFSQDGALAIDLPESGPERILMNVSRCAYAEMYKRNGMAEFGYLLSCGRDYALFEGFNPDIRFTRTQTIMEGADYCDFCLSSAENKTTGTGL
ncbi:L-2-amino-thiazoline-4-carboxylic acid hydrolase [bacterium]|nr:L-2-amino-thiazoline-4-carboxylic acid hydrolase [bacterium]